MCTHISTYEFVPALISTIGEKKKRKKFKIPEKVLLDVSEAVEERDKDVNIFLSRPSLRSLVYSMRDHKTYGTDFIDISEGSNGDDNKGNEQITIELRNVDMHHRRAMSNYYFDNHKPWCSKLEDLVEHSIKIKRNSGVVQFETRHGSLKSLKKK